MTPDSTVPSDTDRLAEIAARLADLDAKIKLRAENAERGIVTPLGAAADRLHQYAPMDLEFLLGKVESLIAHNGELVKEIYFQAKRADEQKALAKQLQGRLDTAEGQLRKVASLQCEPTGDHEDASELGWEDGYNAALAEARHLAAEVLPETIADRHSPMEVYLEFHEFPVQSSKRVICAECSGNPVPWDIDEASIVLWPCKDAAALGLGEGDGQ